MTSAHPKGLQPRHGLDTRREQALLKRSIVVTLFVSAVGLVGGIFSGSQAIVFDGIYSLVDVVLTGFSVALARLVVTQSSRRFQYGYWHLEPLLEVVGGAVLSLACIYAVVNAAEQLVEGGREVAYGASAFWAALLFVVGLGMAIYMRRQSATLASGLLALDARGWLVSSVLSVSLLLGFIGAVLIEGSPLDHWVPYVDSAVLLTIALALIPVPLLASWRALREVLQVAPDDLDREVRTVMDAVIKEHGFIQYSSHVAKIGRARFVEIHILVPPDIRIETVRRVDEIRRDISNRLHANGPHFWLTIDFTGDPEWM